MKNAALALAQLEALLRVLRKFPDALPIEVEDINTELRNHTAVQLRMADVIESFIEEAPGDKDIGTFRQMLAQSKASGN